MRSARRKVTFSPQNGSLGLKRSHHSDGPRTPRRKQISFRGHSMSEAAIESFNVPEYFLRAPKIRDALVTKTSIDQDNTVRECLLLLKAVSDPARDPFEFNEHGVLRLDRTEHIEYLIENLEEFPAQFVGVDASRPWMVYWGLMGLSLLGEDVTPYRSRVIKTFRPAQNVAGGFGGGQGQYSHLAGSYAAMLSLALVGGKEAYDLVDRRSMWQWLGRLKQSDGGFEVCEGGEEDVRGAYCALVIISLLDLPFDLPQDSPARKYGFRNFGDGLGEYLSRCQTYEGGLSAAPGNEAHGAYAFCVLACLCLLEEPQTAFQKYLDIDALLSWLSSRQYAPEGGLAGRTNKLVDACYSHWLGGCWPLIQAALDGPYVQRETDEAVSVGSLFSREGLTRYILNCCQESTGGLRDKPSKRADSYHTCYALAGLSAVQHFHFYEKPPSGDQFGSAFTWNWREPQDAAHGSVFDDQDRVQPFHPVYVIPHNAVQNMRVWAETQDRL